jgi:hypothetical protein
VAVVSNRVRADAVAVPVRTPLAFCATRAAGNRCVLLNIGKFALEGEVELL